MDDIDPASICHPAGFSTLKLLVCKCDPSVVLRLELVLLGSEVRITPKPELFNKSFPLLRSTELFEDVSLFVANDVLDVFLEPLLVIVATLFLTGLLLPGSVSLPLLLCRSQLGSKEECCQHENRCFYCHRAL